MRENENGSIFETSTAYIESEKRSVGRTMQVQVVVDEKTGEQCVTGYDAEGKMKVTLLFQSEVSVDAEKLITETLKRNFVGRLKKELA